MAINQNHLFEDLNGVKCAIVEKNASKQRTDFLRSLLELNGYTVVAVPSPPPKVAPPASTATDSTADVPAVTEPPKDETYTVGVTDVMFNATNAIFGRLLKTPDSRIVTLAYWQQKDPNSHDDVPYFAQPKI